MTTSGIVPNGFQPPGEIRFVKCLKFSFIFIFIKYRTYKRGRLNNTTTFDAGQRHDPPDDKRAFNLGLNM